MTSTPTPSPENVRLTITVTKEVHLAYQRFAKAAGMSLGRAMGEWLEDTMEAASFTATKMEQARAAPKAVMREMHAYAQGLADETGQLMADIREKGRTERSGAARVPSPPPSNTGGKGKNTGRGGRA